MQKLLKFPDTNFSIKLLQQFVDLINYVRDFIPDISTYISLRKKNAPAQGKQKDDVVYKNIQHTQDTLYFVEQTNDTKEKCQQRLLECISPRIKRQRAKDIWTCKWKNQRRTTTLSFHLQKIISLKNGIPKLKFFPIHLKFQIKIDKRAFPNMVQLNPKIIPNPQIL